jgi:fructose-1,6-bisphosphatase/inositol monophosphatase family enzyme
MDTHQTLLAFAERLAKKAGAIMDDYFNAANQGVETKPDNSPVTIADKLINQMVIDEVTAAYPNHGVLSEEGSSHADRNELWVCDPIDGTRAFIQGVPTAMFSLAYVVDGEPQVAVIYDPIQKKLYSASKGTGTTLNGKPVHVSTTSKLAQANVAAVTGYDQLQERRPLFDALAERGANQVIVPGNVFKGSLVVFGSIDAYVFPGLSAHDVAANKLIIEEAGGKVTDIFGHQQRYDGAIQGAIMTNGLLHDELVTLVADFNAESYLGY